MSVYWLLGGIITLTFVAGMHSTRLRALRDRIEKLERERNV